jgi:hypothetical protein
MASSRFFWFQLADAVSGQILEGSTADKVSLPDGSDVADFRDTAKVKCSNKLSSVDSNNLLVYKNRAAFDKRNDDEEKEEPLEEDALISGLGLSKKEALIVAVPSSIQSLQARSPCQIPFYSDIHGGIESEGWISFQQVIPGTSLTKLYVRESYQSIATDLKPGINKAIITGTPGIGKSLFLFYLLWKLVKEGKRVLFIYHPDIIYYDGQGGVFMMEKLPPTIYKTFWNETLWCLFDSKLKNEANLAECAVDDCTFVLSTSPRRQLVNELKKTDCQIFYMPIWTEKEMKVIAPSYTKDEDQWRDRFRVLGGIPRSVLRLIAKSPNTILEEACSHCSLDDCIRAIDLNSTITDQMKVIHSLIHITSKDPFVVPSVCYASPTALDMIVRKKGD